MITHVAIWRNDTIYALPNPNRHHHIFQIMDEADHKTFNNEIQGFLDDQGNFLDRREAYILATNEGQIARNPNPANYQGDELFSEDLW
jgi:hypothetical protein